MVTLLELAGAIEINCGEAEIRKAGPVPEVTVSWNTALFEAVSTFTAKLPLGMPDGMVTTTFQVPSPAIFPVASVSPTYPGGPESHLRVTFSPAGN
jgi:hypothetical protein